MTLPEIIGHLWSVYLHVSLVFALAIVFLPGVLKDDDSPFVEATRSRGVWMGWLMAVAIIFLWPIAIGWALTQRRH